MNLGDRLTCTTSVLLHVGVLPELLPLPSGGSCKTVTSIQGTYFEVTYVREVSKSDVLRYSLRSCKSHTLHHLPVIYFRQAATSAIGGGGGRMEVEQTACMVICPHPRFSAFCSSELASFVQLCKLTTAQHGTARHCKHIE